MLEDFAWLVLAHGLLRVCKPLRAHAILLHVGAFATPLRSAEEVRLASRRLAGRGTCLSRCLALAARAPDAEVVIGVSMSGTAPLFAHAWLEMNGVPVDPFEVAGEAIARLRGRRGGRPARATT